MAEQDDKHSTSLHTQIDQINDELNSILRPESAKNAQKQCMLWSYVLYLVDY